LVHLLKYRIKIPEKEWSSFNCILIVPDIFVRRHIKMLVHSIFDRIGFRKLYIHLESVMACFGTAVSSACVVDIGHEKISVCCVDEGVILPRTLVRKNFGSKDISKILTKIFNERISDPLVGSLKSNS
jgi:actin-related protein 8